MTTKNHVADVGVRLVVDSNAKQVTDDLKHGLVGAEQHAERSAKGIKGKLASLMKGGAGLLLSGVTLAGGAALAAGGALFGLAHKSAEAFQEADDAVRKTAGTLMLVDRNANSFERLADLGDDIKSSMEQLGIASGVSSNVLLTAFDDVIERGGKTVEQTHEIVESMAYVGRIVPGGVATLGAAFDQIQAGMVRAKNPIVGIIASTKVLKGSAKEVAMQMQKMSVEKQMALAETAMTKFAAKMKDTPLTLGQMKEGIGIVVGNLFENAGRPITKALEPIMGKVHAFFAGNQDELYAKAEEFGEKLARGVEIAGAIFDEVSKMVKDTWGEIEGSVSELTGPFRETFEYVYENREAFAKTIAEGMHLMITAAKWIIKAFTAIRDTVFGVMKAIGKSGLLGSDLPKFIGEEERGGVRKDMRAKVMEKGGLSNDEFAKFRQQIVESAQSTGESVPDALADFDAAYRNAMDTHTKTMADVSIARDAALEDDAKKYASAFDVAAKSHDKAAMQYVAEFLKGNLSLQNAIAKEGPEIFKEGFDTFLKTLKEMGNKDIADELKKATKPNLGIPSKGNIVQNFNGPISVKQDFRDQNPDRIMVMMKRDFARQGVNRLQARTGSVFGF